MRKILMSCILFCFGSAANATVMGIGNFTDNGGGSFTVSSGFGAVSDMAIEGFLGLSGGTLDGLAVTTSSNLVTEGSAIKDTFSVSIGDIFSFDWLWTSDEFTNTSFFNDFAFYSLSLDGTDVLADTFTPGGTSGSFSWAADSAGILDFGAGVVDVGDTSNFYPSFLTVSGIDLQTATVPEPGTLTLMGLGLLGLGVNRRRRASLS